MWKIHLHFFGNYLFPCCMNSSIRPPTILDVAKAAGVGVGTVSRAINNQPSVSKDAMKAVRRAMAQLNYSPPPPGRRRGFRAAGSKPSRPGNKLGKVTIIILAEYGIDWVLRKAPVFASVLHGAQSTVEAKGGVLSMRQASGWAQLLTAVQQCKGSPCLIMGEEPPGEPPSQIRRTAVVWVMGSVRRFEGDHVQPDHFSLGQMAAVHVLGRGHRSAAYLGDPVSPLFHVSMRAAAFQWWLASEGVEAAMLVDSAVISSGPNVHQANEDVLTRLVDRFCALTPRPTALLLQADILAPHVYNLLRERGVRPMEDVEILTCNREQAYLSHLKPQPVTLDLQAESIGRRAVEQLLWRAAHPNEASMRVMIEPLLIMPEGHGPP
jgi:LacI family transcriptional regulator